MKTKIRKSLFASCFIATLSASSLLAVERGVIPANSKVFIGEMGGFGSYVIATITKKKLPLQIVTDKEQADFEITGESESQKAGWAKTIFLKQTGSAEQASINVVNLKTSTIVYGYAVNKGNSLRGKQSAAEVCAKHLKEVVGK